MTGNAFGERIDALDRTWQVWARLGAALPYLQSSPEMPPSALRQTARLLAGLAPPVDVIEAASGRSATSPLPLPR